jgi:hypothetical protein
VKKTLGTILAIPVALALFADAGLAQETTFGFKGGLTLSSLRGSFTDEDLSNVQFERKTSFTIGGFVAFPVGSSAFIQPEFLFTRRVTNALDESLDISTELTFDYIEIPVLLKFSRGGRGETSPALYAGPQVAIGLGAKATDQALGIELDIADELVDVEFGIVIGGGIDFGQRSYLDVRYYLGLSNIVKDDVFDNGLFDANDDFKSGVFTLMFGVGF